MVVLRWFRSFVQVLLLSSSALNLQAVSEAAVMMLLGHSTVALIANYFQRQLDFERCLFGCQALSRGSMPCGRTHVHTADNTFNLHDGSFLWAIIINMTNMVAPPL